MPSQLLNRVEAAAYVGLSVHAIDRAVQRGKLKKAGRGQFSTEDLDAFRDNSDPAGAERGAVQAAIHAAKKEQPNSSGTGKTEPRVQAEEVVAPSQSDATEPRPDRFGATLVAAKTKTAVMQANKAELDFKERRGELLSRHDVKQHVAGACRKVTQRMRAWPSRMGPMLASINDASECASIIETEVRQLLAEFQEDMADI